MNSFWNKRRKIYGCIILLSAFIVLFVGRTFNKEKMESQISLAWNAITNFKKGLDISGGTRLMYRIDYDTYEQVYSKNASELAAVKSTVENVIKKNIDNRISKLGVSDYRSYTQQLDNETQIVVEIGGVADLDQAKELIGKTVELEFKLPNENEGTEQEKSERMTLAQSLYNDLLSNPSKFEAIAGSRQSENIYYNSYDNVTLAQLPDIYQENSSVLNEVNEGDISPLMDGLYYSYQYQNYSGEVENVDLKGYTFFHMISKETGSRSGVNLDDILEVSKSLGATYDKDFTVIKDGTDITSGSYIIEGDTLKYNNGEIYSNEIAYDAKILAMVDAEFVDDEENTNSEENFAEKVNNAKSSLLDNIDVEIPEASPIYDGIISLVNLKAAIPSFDINNTETVQVYEMDGITYLIAIRDIKSEDEKRFNFMIVNGVNEDSFNTALESQTFYTIEEVFVQDRLTWKNAQSSDGRILNGANFKYASVSTSQLGKPVVVINFDDIGKEIFCDITTNNIGKEMAIFIGGVMVTDPVIQTKICDGSAQIDGGFTPETAKEKTNELNDGALPAPLILMQEEKVSPTLGENALNGAIITMIIGFLLIFVYMTSLYGWKKGLISLISLTIYTIVLLAIVKIIKYVLSLSGIAAIILSIGMAVDANVLIFERMREEKENKKSDSEAIDVAYDRSWNAIRDGQISTGMIGAVLALMGINMFKGFGFMLVIGVLLTLLINAPIIKELLHIFYRKKD